MTPLFRQISKGKTPADEVNQYILVEQHIYNVAGIPDNEVHVCFLVLFDDNNITFGM